MKFKRLLMMSLATVMSLSMLTGCGSDDATTGGDDQNYGATTGSISVVSREDGSGTRVAFVELFGVEQKDAEGNKVDYTTEMAEITNSTSVMMSTIAGNERAIGYVSLGALNETVKALDIDGVSASVDNIKNGTYSVSRPFNVVTNGELSPEAQDFMTFIMSEQGQAVVEDSGYISQGNNGTYTAGSVSGKVVAAGSSSVTPVMEKLKEAYIALNPNVEIEVQQSDSTTGVNSAIEGICDLGMASRELKDSEVQAGLTSTAIALDGIAVIVNNNNSFSGLTTEQVCSIFTGEITDWSELE